VEGWRKGGRERAGRGGGGTDRRRGDTHVCVYVCVTEGEGTPTSYAGRSVQHEKREREGTAALGSERKAMREREQQHWARERGRGSEREGGRGSERERERQEREGEAGDRERKEWLYCTLKFADWSITARVKLAPCRRRRRRRQPRFGGPGHNSEGGKHRVEGAGKARSGGRRWREEAGQRVTGGVETEDGTVSRGVKVEGGNRGGSGGGG
jgi:hypothetical protein